MASTPAIKMKQTSNFEMQIYAAHVYTQKTNHQNNSEKKKTFNLSVVEPIQQPNFVSSARSPKFGEGTRGISSMDTPTNLLTSISTSKDAWTQKSKGHHPIVVV